MVAAARVDGSGTGHTAGGIKGQALTTTTTGIIAAESGAVRSQGCCRDHTADTELSAYGMHLAGDCTRRDVA
jgi:hypothetical protein